MTQLPSNQTHKFNRKALAWALFSQSIWLPAILIDTQDRLAAYQSDYNFKSIANLPNQHLPEGWQIGTSLSDSRKSASVAQSLQSKNTSGIILNSIASRSRDISAAISDPPPHSNASSIAFVPPPRLMSSLAFALVNEPIINTQDIESIRLVGSKLAPNSVSKHFYTRADLLGGSITLHDLNEPEMPPIARAERAQWSRSGDPLAPIPQIWREPMRRALKDLNANVRSASSQTIKTTSELEVDPARVVHVPSAKIRHATEVPLALQSDGSVDILNTPDDPVVVEEIQSWSSKQQLPTKGRMSPAVVHLHPLPEVSGVHERGRPPLESSSASAYPDPGSVRQQSSSEELPPTSFVAPSQATPSVSEVSPSNHSPGDIDNQVNAEQNASHINSPETVSKSGVQQ